MKEGGKEGGKEGRKEGRIGWKDRVEGSNTIKKEGYRADGQGGRKKTRRAEMKE
jgi:hypothetical protein